MSQDLCPFQHCCLQSQGKWGMLWKFGLSPVPSAFASCKCAAGHSGAGGMYDYCCRRSPTYPQAAVEKKLMNIAWSEGGRWGRGCSPCSREANKHSHAREMLLTLANISPIPFPPLLSPLLSSMSERSAVLTMPSEAPMCSGFPLECQVMLSAFPHPHSQA